MTLEHSFEKLRLLDHCARGFPFYYGKLLQGEDLVLRVAAATALLDMRALRYPSLPALLPLSRHGGVRNRVINYLADIGEHQWIDRVMAEPISEDRQALFEKFHRAQIAGHFAEAAELARALYLADGSFDWLVKAQELAEAEGGWRNAIADQVYCILAMPSDPRGPHALLDSLANANAFDLVQDVIRIFQDVRAYPMECTVFRAKFELKKGNYRDAIAMLPKDAQGIISEALQITYWDTLALAHRGLGNFKEALVCYQKKNQASPAGNIRPESYYENIASLSMLRVEGSNSGVARADVIMLLGFPRSGTTLLENALAAHPSIETFEETPFFALAERHVRKLGKIAISQEDSEEARSLYYDAIERRSRKLGAKVFLDKLPLRSANAEFLGKIFPGQKYIFSIRHPYDVVLSCFFQFFTPNVAMVNFRTFAGACRLYDFAMSEWFRVFSLESPEVHYVRYENLVNAFENTTAGVCNFMGVPMESKVLDFAQNAQARPVKTPSYAKVRQGISIGVQTYWKDFGFLFETPEAKSLERWVKHFGYQN